jgi:CheY-like chemotaxis protein
MTARVLVVDDVPANVKLLEARLSAEYFDVVTAMSGPAMKNRSSTILPFRTVQKADLAELMRAPVNPPKSAAPAY